jgi:hypothetical protein
MDVLVVLYLCHRCCTNGNPPPPDWPAASDHKTSEDYIALAKQLIPTVYDEADIDSIRAMAIIVSTWHECDDLANVL